MYSNARETDGPRRAWLYCSALLPEKGLRLLKLRPLRVRAVAQRYELGVQRPESSVKPTLSYEVLYSALASLAEPDRRLIEQLYWEDQTEAEVAQQLAITQQAVSKRKRAILTRLHVRFAACDKDADWLVVKRNGRRN